jgi:hypothetical protein
MLEQADTFAKEHEKAVDLDVVKQPGFYVLLRDVRAARHRDILLAWVKSGRWLSRGTGEAGRR